MKPGPFSPSLVLILEINTTKPNANGSVHDVLVLLVLLVFLVLAFVLVLVLLVLAFVLVLVLV